jgi:hypothetical protein
MRTTSLLHGWASSSSPPLPWVSPHRLSVLEQQSSVNIWFERPAQDPPSRPGRLKPDTDLCSQSVPTPSTRANVRLPSGYRYGSNLLCTNYKHLFRYDGKPVTVSNKPQPPPPGLASPRARLEIFAEPFFGVIVKLEEHVNPGNSRWSQAFRGRIVSAFRRSSKITTAHHESARVFIKIYDDKYFPPKTPRKDGKWYAQVETVAYCTLQKLQGSGIPWLYGMVLVSVVGSSDVPIRSSSLFFSSRPTTAACCTQSSSKISVGCRCSTQYSPGTSTSLRRSANNWRSW